MKVLSVRYNGRELASGPLYTPLILLGRSPICDLVLRAPGLKPVHFLLEWIGVGEFGVAEGQWAIFDISGQSSGSEVGLTRASTGVGQILGETPLSIGQYEFSWREDRLAETDLTEGVISRTISKTQIAAKGLNPQNCQLEVVSIRQDSGSVFNVAHVDPPGNGASRIVFIHDLPVKIEWNRRERDLPVRLDMSEMNEFEIFQRGHKIEGAEVTLATADFVQIKWNLANYYFRLVPKIEIPPAPYQLLKDKFSILTVLALLLIGYGLHYVRSLPMPPQEKPPEPPRIARIEVKEVATTPPPTPEPKIKAPVQKEVDAKPAPEAKPAEALKPEEKKAAMDIGPSKNVSAPKAKFTNLLKKEKSAGLNSPAPTANVNSIGLLGALSKSKSTVSADKVINDGIISKTVSSSDGTVKLKAPPAGTLGKTTRTDGGLAAAYTTVGSGDAEAGKALAVADRDAAQGGKIRFEGGGALDDAQGEFTAEGGLDKESVRRAILAYRKDIRTCYERALLTNAKVGGRIKYKWEIAPSGAVRWVNMTETDVKSPTLPSCVKDVVKSIHFPKAANGQKTVVIYPFAFQSKK